jgi:hypothetical protein
MISITERVAVLSAGLVFFIFVFHIFSRRPVIFVSFIFILFTLTWRMLATMYIDLEGPVYSSQLARGIGPGTVTVIHAIAYIISLMPFLYFFRQSAVERWCAEAQRSPPLPATITLSDVTFLLSVVFLSVLFSDLARRGSIPLFAHIERFVYTSQYAGTAHRWLIRYGNFVAFWWGMMFAADYIRSQRFDWRMPGLLCALAVYAFLTGNRFSAFYSETSFFITPWAAVVALRYRNSDRSLFSWIGQSVGSRTSRFVATGSIIALIGIVFFGVYNNLANVRGFSGDEIWRQAFDRILIQPSEIGWTSFERVFESGQSQPSVAFRFLFQHPVDASRNTSIQYLMFATIGEPQTTDQISRGFQLAGGFPEIFFELFGPYFAWPFLLGAGCITAALTAYVVRATLRGDFASAFLSLYVLFGFYVMYIGGMLNFVTAGTYWIKISAFAAALWMEQRLARAGRPLVPWTLVRIPDSGWLRTVFTVLLLKRIPKATQ